MVYLIPASQCNCKTCNGGHPAPPGVFGGSRCTCPCHNTGVDKRYSSNHQGGLIVSEKKSRELDDISVQLRKAGKYGLAKRVTDVATELDNESTPDPARELLEEIKNTLKMMDDAGSFNHNALDIKVVSSIIDKITKHLEGNKK